MWVAKGTKVYRCCPEQLRSLSPEQEAMVRLLPADMVHVRHEVSAKGAGNFYDISVLEKPPDTVAAGSEESSGSVATNQGASIPVPEVSMGSQVEQKVDASQLEAVVASEPVLSPLQHDEGEPLLSSLEHDDPRQTDTGEQSPGKRLRTDPLLSLLTRALRADVDLLDPGGAIGGVASSSLQPAEVPVPKGTDDDLEVTVVDGQDHWILDHRHSQLVGMHVVERRVNWSPSVLELPVLVEDVEPVCQALMFLRNGERQSREYEYEWRRAETVAKTWAVSGLVKLYSNSDKDGDGEVSPRMSALKLEAPRRDARRSRSLS